MYTINDTGVCLLVLVVTVMGEVWVMPTSGRLLILFFSLFCPHQRCLCACKREASKTQNLVLDSAGFSTHNSRSCMYLEPVLYCSGGFKGPGKLGATTGETMDQQPGAETKS